MSAFNIFQVAYVTDDIDRATAADNRFGIPQFSLSRNTTIETGGGPAQAHFALAFLGATQIEIIQPAGGADGVYRDGIRPGTLTLHHLGCLITDESAWRATLAALEAEGCATPIRGNFGGLMHYVYADRRRTYGHYFEYMFQTEAGRHLFDNVPRYPGPPALSVP